MQKKKFDKVLHQLGGNRARLAVLIDPDKFNPELVVLANQCKVLCFLVGGSRLRKNNLHEVVKQIKKLSDLPVVLFPGDETQLSALADGLLLISLLSGRNPDYLIGKHVLAAPIIKKMQLPVLPTAYLLIQGKGTSSTQNVSNTLPLNPKNKGLLKNTALAAEQLGFKALYLEAGSGSQSPVSPSLIKTLKKELRLPLIVGGGLNTPSKVKAAINAGANLLVVGNALENNVHLLSEISECFV